MKRVWKKFSLLGSFIALASLVSAATVSTAPAPENANELTLAGIRPGRDKINSPKKTFRGLEQNVEAKDGYVWGDICTHRDLRVEVDSKGLVRSVTVSSSYKLGIMAKCLESVMSPERLKMLRSGRGLQLGDSCSRVTEIYGKPDSESPSVRGSEQLQLYFYSFGWAGSDVPQVMEVSCAQASGKVVEIMLAASSL